MATACSLLALVSLLLCGFALSSDVDALTKSLDKKSGAPFKYDTEIKITSVREGSDDDKLHEGGHTVEDGTKPSGGAEMHVKGDKDSAEGTGRMIEASRILETMGGDSAALNVAEHQWGRRCGQTIPYWRPVSCELRLGSFRYVLRRLDIIRVSALVAYGGIGVQLELIYGNIVTDAGLAVGRQPTYFKDPDDIDGKKALWVFPINQLPAPRYGSCCWKRVNFKIRVYSCLNGNCGTEVFSLYFTLRCRPVCHGRGRPLPMTPKRRCPWCRR